MTSPAHPVAPATTAEGTRSSYRPSEASPKDPTTGAGHVQPEGEPEPSQERGWDDWDDDWQASAERGSTRTVLAAAGRFTPAPGAGLAHLARRHRRSPSSGQEVRDNHAYDHDHSRVERHCDTHRYGRGEPVAATRGPPMRLRRLAERAHRGQQAGHAGPMGNPYHLPRIPDGQQRRPVRPLHPLHPDRRQSRRPGQRRRRQQRPVLPGRLPALRWVADNVYGLWGQGENGGRGRPRPRLPRLAEPADRRRYPKTVAGPVRQRRSPRGGSVGSRRCRRDGSTEAARSGPCGACTAPAMSPGGHRVAATT